MRTKPITITIAIHTLITASLLFGLAGTKAAAQNADYSDFRGAYLGKLTTVAGDGTSANGPAIAVVAPSRNGQSVRIDIQGNFILNDDQFAYDTIYRINRRGRVKTTNLIVFANESVTTLDLRATSRARLTGRRLRARFSKTISGSPITTNMQMRFNRRNLVCTYRISTPSDTVRISGNLRKRLGD